MKLNSGSNGGMYQMKIRLLVINQYFPPDRAATGQLLASLCHGLKNLGFDITVLCGQPSYTEDAPGAASFEQCHGLKIYRVDTGGVKGRSVFRRRLKGYLGFMFSAFKRLVYLTRMQKFDVIITASNPPIAGLLGTLALKRCGGRFLYMIHDITPDTLVHTGKIGRGPLLWFWHFINSLIYRSANSIVVLGPLMKDYMKNAKGIPGEKLHVIPNWSVHGPAAPAKATAFRTANNLGEAFVVLYSGNMGIAHNLEVLIEAAWKLKEEKLKEENIIFLFAGDGEKRPILQKLAEAKNLTNVRFLPHQPENEYKNMLDAADLCVVALEHELAGMSVPSKTYAVLAAGKPILALCAQNDDIAGLINAHKCGWRAPGAGAVCEIISNLINDRTKLFKAGARSRAAYEQYFSRDKAVGAYARLLSKMVSGPLP